MIISQQSIEELTDILCGDETTYYRSGPKLVDFFSSLGFSDSYGQGFPSRKTYAKTRIEEINGTPQLDKCIKIIFDPRNYAKNISDVDIFIRQFNIFLEFDGWQVERNRSEIKIEKVKRINAVDTLDESQEHSEDGFLTKEFPRPNLEKLKFESGLVLILQNRLDELDVCIKHEVSLASVVLAGSILEGVLLFFGVSHMQKFQDSKLAPKEKQTGEVKDIYAWNLYKLIEVAHDCGYIDQDIIKFSHALRDYRNFIHPGVQYAQNFKPTIHTARICYQVVLGTINQLADNS